MKHINKTYWKMVAIVGNYLNRSNWFVVVMVPAIAGQRYCFAVMIGTHKRYGVLLPGGKRWLLTARGIQGEAG